MYAGLPVVIVQAWSDVNATSLAQHHHELSDTNWTAVHSRITVDAFVQRIVHSITAATAEPG